MSDQSKVPPYARNPQTNQAIDRIGGIERESPRVVRPERIYAFSGKPLSRTTPEEIRLAAISHGFMDHTMSLGAADFESMANRIDEAHLRGVR